MAYLDIRTALTTIERAMVDAISLAYQWRVSEVADLDALRALDAAPAWDGQLRYVLSEGVVYRYRLYSGNDERLPYVVAPSNITGRGRWERQSSAVTKGPNYLAPVHRVRYGYAKAVQLWEGQVGSDEALERIFGLCPAYLIRWVSDDIGSRTTAGPYGALYSYDLSFEIWCFSKNFRPQNQALLGSEITAESTATSDPGLNRMMGDIRYLFGNGTNLGLGPGVAQCRINGAASILEEDLDSRQFVGVVPIKVQASFNIPDEDLVPIEEVWTQFQDAGLPVNEDGTYGEADITNFLAQGYRITPGPGLSGTPSGGVAYINGVLVSSTPGANVFAANSDTYRYLRADGSLIYQATGHDHPRPIAPANTLLIGMTRTGTSDVESDTLLCGHSINAGEPFRAA